MSSRPDITITFDEKVKGWTSFHSFMPDFMVGMNNNFLSFRDGELYLHHSEDVARNILYGIQYPTKISLMVNDSPSEIKELQAVSLEGNVSWEALITAYVSSIDDYSRSTIQEVEFVKKEGKWYAHARRNEETNFNSKSTYGIGEVTEVNFPTIKVKGYSSSLTAGDTLVNGTDFTTVGEVVSATTLNGITTITLTSVGTFAVGNFVVGRKNDRVEGGNLRGYTMRMDLTVMKDNIVELFSVNSEVIKSYS